MTLKKTKKMYVIQQNVIQEIKRPDSIYKIK